MINNNKKALIHIAKMQVGMTSDEYAAMLDSFGVSSSKELNSKNFEAIMRHFEKIGFKKKGKPWKPVPSKDRLLKRIWELSDEMCLSHKYVAGIASKMFSICRVEWCNAEQLRKIVAALVYYKLRKK